MNWADLTIFPAAPDMVLTVVLFFVLLVDLWLSDKQRWLTSTLAIIGLIITAVVQCAVWGGQPQSAFHDMFILDGIAQVSKLCMYIAVIVLFIYSQNYLQNRNIYQGEFYTLTLFALLGMNIMVSASHFLTLYIGLELLSLALYALIALQRHDQNATEAALKYFVLGALASGLLLYGISFIYGATGSLQLNEVLNASENANSWLLKLGLVFVTVAIAFKLGGVPFHMWVPDVYQGAPTAVAALVGTVPKIAATVFAFRILVIGLSTQYAFWHEMLLLIGLASLLIGNLTAIMQTNIKRMLGFSTVSHMGFIVLAFAAGQFAGIAAAFYYAITYALMAGVAFGILMLLSDKQVECENISDLAGLNQKYPWYAFLMLLAMFSMAGIPPLMGFYAKLAVIKALLAQGFVWVSVYAVVMSLIGAFYYLRVVKTMYFDAPAAKPQSLSMGGLAKAVLAVNALLLLLWGILPESVMRWCVAALQNS